MKTERTLSVVIACYKDAGSVQEMYKRLTNILPTVTPDYEIIFVNDASPDNAEELITKITEHDERVVLVNHTRNFGSQNAFLSGMKISRGDAVVLMDGDLQDPPRLIPEFVDKWLEGFHIVYGVRVKRKESRFRQASYKIFYRLFRKLAKFKIPLDAGDFGLIDRTVVDTLLNHFPEKLVFLRGLRAYTGFRHTGVDYIREERFDGVSTNSFMGNIRWAKLAIFSFSEKPLEYISLLAFFSVILTGIASLFYLGTYFFNMIAGYGGAPPGYMTLLMAVLFFSSVQLICFSILAEYLGHIYQEIKGRPRYIVRDVIDNRKPPANSSSKTVQPE